jgi:hypothetical protein
MVQQRALVSRRAMIGAWTWPSQPAGVRLLMTRRPFVSRTATCASGADSPVQVLEECLAEIGILASPANR